MSSRLMDRRVSWRDFFDIIRINDDKFGDRNSGVPTRVYPAALSESSRTLLKEARSEQCIPKGPSGGQHRLEVKNDRHVRNRILRHI